MLLRQRKPRGGDNILPVVVNDRYNASNFSPRKGRASKKNSSINAFNMLKMILFGLSLFGFCFMVTWLIYPNANKATHRDTMDLYKQRMEENHDRNEKRTMHRDYNNERANKYNNQRAKTILDRQQKRRKTPPKKRKDEKNRNGKYGNGKIAHTRNQEIAPTANPTSRLAINPTSAPMVKTTPKAPTTKPTLSPTTKQDASQTIGKAIFCSDNKTEAILNDDYCDCTDGSDEPDTDACSNILVQKSTFRCKDGGRYIHASRVKDGVKDCEDGSDEII